MKKVFSIIYQFFSTLALCFICASRKKDYLLKDRRSFNRRMRKYPQSRELYKLMNKPLENNDKKEE